MNPHPNGYYGIFCFSQLILRMSSFSNLQVVEVDPSKEELFPGIKAMKEELQVVLNAVTVMFEVPWM